MAKFRELWIRWKMLRLPWRRTFLIGQDLSGNTFWEFKDKLNANRFRRIAKPPRHTKHLSDLKLSPSWHQWLRHTRTDAPTIQEQQSDLIRQAQLKHNAQLADERWASKPRYIEKPKPRTPIPTRPSAAVEDEGSTSTERPTQVQQHSQGLDRPNHPGSERSSDPWADNDARSKPGAKWEPEAWVPGALKR